MTASIEQTIRAFLVEQALVPADDPLPPTASLIAAGFVDSLGVLDLVAFLESHFAVDLEPEDITAANFDSLAAMARLVRLRRPDADGGNAV